MNEPTEEQIKEFWERCGFTKRISDGGHGYIYGLEYWSYPGSLSSITEPLPIDLNNLFKWAVPKLDYAKVVTNDAPSGDRFYNGKAMSEGRWGACTEDDPALALFWAIWKVIKK